MALNEQGGGLTAASPNFGPVTPFGRQARLNALVDGLRAENWDVTGSLETREVGDSADFSEPPASVEDDDGAAD